MKYTIWLIHPIRTGKEDIYSIHEVYVIEKNTNYIIIKDKTAQTIPWHNIALIELILK